MQIFGVSRLLFGEHDSLTRNDVDTRALHYFAIILPNGSGLGPLRSGQLIAR